MEHVGSSGGVVRLSMGRLLLSPTLHTQGMIMAHEHSHTSDEHEKNHPLLSRVMERNIHTITHLRLDAARARTLQDCLADAITDFSGSMLFVYFHIVWFGAWIAVHSGWLGLIPFDLFPYGLLTMIVSLEAIFLSTFVLISRVLVEGGIVRAKVP